MMYILEFFWKDLSFPDLSTEEEIPQQLIDARLRSSSETINHQLYIFL